MEPVDLISHQYRFDISDGRRISGILIAIDDQSNLLITNATEAAPTGHTRELGLVSIRRSTVDRIWVSKQEHGQIFANSQVI